MNLCWNILYVVRGTCVFLRTCGTDISVYWLGRFSYAGYCVHLYIPYSTKWKPDVGRGISWQLTHFSET